MFQTCHDENSCSGSCIMLFPVIPLSHTQHWAQLLSCWPWGAKLVSQQISVLLLSLVWQTETWSWRAVLRGGWVPPPPHKPVNSGKPIAGAGICHHRTAQICCALTHSIEGEVFIFILPCTIFFMVSIRPMLPQGPAWNFCFSMLLKLFKE